MIVKTNLELAVDNFNRLLEECRDTGQGVSVALEGDYGILMGGTKAKNLVIEFHDSED